MADEISEELMNKKAEMYPSTIKFVKGDMPRDKFWKYFIKVDFKDYWNWVCLAAAVFLFWWSFRMIFASFS